MKTIEVDEDLYSYIASQTQHIGESASDILRRLLAVEQSVTTLTPVTKVAKTQSQGIVVGKEAAFDTQLNGVKSMRELLISDEFALLNKAIDRFMLILERLHHIDNASFAKATKVKGRKRVYFADNQELLLASGKTTKPRLIKGSPFWVITNTNTSRKQQMVQQLMEKMNFPQELAEKVANSI